MTPDRVTMAAAIMDNREYGLNWRLDAAKDIGDMDAIRGQSGRNVTKRFKLEAYEGLKRWDQLIRGNKERDLHGVKPYFNKATVIGEFTDFDNPIFDKISPTFFSDAVRHFDSIPNFRFAFNRFPSWIHHLRRAGEIDAETDFEASRVHSDMYMMANTLPWSVVRSMQQMCDTHDVESLPHVFLINQAISNFDLHPYNGLKDHFTDAVEELTYKSSVGYEKKLLQEVLGSAVNNDLARWEETFKAENLSERLGEWLENADSLTAIQKDLAGCKTEPVGR